MKTALSVLVFVVMTALVPQLGQADVGAFPTGLVNECGVRGILSLHITASKRGGITREYVVVGFGQLMAGMLMSTPTADTVMFPVLHKWFNEIGPNGYLMWVGHVYDTYDNPPLAFRAERLLCEKRAAKEIE